MLTLNDGRTELWQWDTGRTLAVDADCSQVHFSNKVFGRSIDVDVADGVAIIPDVLLQTDNDLNVWAFAGTAENGYTKISKTFKVNRRNKPADYVFTPTDQMTLQTIQIQIGDLADLTTEAKDTLVAAINEAARTGGGAGSMDLRVAGGYVQYSRDGGMTWTNLIAMEDLKGDPGAPGADGKSAYQYAQDGGYTGSEAEFAAKMAKEIPEALPNPNALTFTGAVNATYDGSEPLTVDVPSGGDNGGAWELVADVTMETDVQQIDIALSKSCKRVWVAVTLYGSKQNSGKSDFYIFVGDKDYKNMIGNTNKVKIDFSSAGMIWNFQSLYAEVSGGVIHGIRGYQTSSAFSNGWETPGNYPSASLMELFCSAPFEKIETVRLQMWGVYFGAGTRVVVRGT